ncbi:MAG TPA: CoA transferase, partial [Actinomycetota bacterium]
HGLDLREDPHLAARRALVTVEHPEVGPATHAGNPIRLSRSVVTPAGAAPCLGADTEEVLGRLLGIGADEVRRLEAAGVCR